MRRPNDCWWFWSLQPSVFVETRSGEEAGALYWVDSYGSTKMSMIWTVIDARALEAKGWGTLQHLLFRSTDVTDTIRSQNEGATEVVGKTWLLEMSSNDSSIGAFSSFYSLWSSKFGLFVERLSRCVFRSTTTPLSQQSIRLSSRLTFGTLLSQSIFAITNARLALQHELYTRI